MVDGLGVERGAAARGVSGRNRFSVLGGAHVYTPDGLCRVDDLVVGDRVVTGARKTASVLRHTTSVFSGGVWLVTFSNGEGLVLPDFQRLVRLVGGGRVDCSVGEVAGVFNGGGQVFCAAPDCVDGGGGDNGTRVKLLEGCVGARALTGCGFLGDVSLAAKVLPHKVVELMLGYAFLLNNVPVGGFAEEYFSGLLPVVEREFGGHVARVLKHGRLPSWFFGLPLSDRLCAAGVLVDNVSGVSCDYGRGGMVVDMVVNNHFLWDLSVLFGGVGCVRTVDVFPTVRQLSTLSFYANDELQGLSLVLSKRLVGGEACFKGCVLGVNSVEFLSTGDDSFGFLHSVELSGRSGGLIVGHSPVLLAPQ